jgi:hypothetical protein
MINSLEALHYASPIISLLTSLCFNSSHLLFLYVTSLSYITSTRDNGAPHTTRPTPVVTIMAKTVREKVLMCKRCAISGNVGMRDESKNEKGGSRCGNDDIT